nr:FreD-C1 [Lineus ruber]
MKTFACLAFFALAGCVLPLHHAVQACRAPQACAIKPKRIHNGIFARVSDPNQNDAFAFSCNNGFALHGKAIVTCCNGTWDAFPTCVAIDCKAHYDSGNTKDGAYMIYPGGQATPILVYCDMTNGGWTVIQRRKDKSVDFFRTWADYKAGFGQYNVNFWIGLDNLHKLTVQNSEIYFFMKASSTENRYALYSTFRVADEARKYRLSVSGYSGTAGDSMKHHNNMMFSTVDADNDLYTDSCAGLYKGAWWYNTCHHSNPNGLFLNGPHDTRYAEGIEWYTYKGQHHSMVYFEMKIKPNMLPWGS